MLIRICGVEILNNSIGKVIKSVVFNLYNRADADNTELRSLRASNGFIKIKIADSRCIDTSVFFGYFKFAVCFL